MQTRNIDDESIVIGQNLSFPNTSNHTLQPVIRAETSIGVEQPPSGWQVVHR